MKIGSTRSYSVSLSQAAAAEQRQHAPNTGQGGGTVAPALPFVDRLFLNKIKPAQAGEFLMDRLVQRLQSDFGLDPSARADQQTPLLDTASMAQELRRHISRISQTGESLRQSLLEETEVVSQTLKNLSMLDESSHEIFQFAKDAIRGLSLVSTEANSLELHARSDKPQNGNMSAIALYTRTQQLLDTV